MQHPTMVACVVKQAGKSIRGGRVSQGGNALRVELNPGIGNRKSLGREGKGLHRLVLHQGLFGSH